MLSQDDIEWAEKFYTEWETGMGKPRPADYLERAEKVLSGHFVGKRRVRTSGDTCSPFIREDYF